MTKMEVLCLLKEVLHGATISKTDPDDASGCNTIYYVDHEQLMRNLEDAIEKESIEMYQKVEPKP